MPARAVMALVGSDQSSGMKIEMPYKILSLGALLLMSTQVFADSIVREVPKQNDTDCVFPHFIDFAFLMKPWAEDTSGTLTQFKAKSFEEDHTERL